MPRKKAPSRGGFREGSGRHKYKEGAEELVRKTVTLPPGQIAFLVGLGGGQLSAGIRKLVEEKMATSGEAADSDQAGSGQEG